MKSIFLIVAALVFSQSALASQYENDCADNGQRASQLFYSTYLKRLIRDLDSIRALQTADKKTKINNPKLIAHEELFSEIGAVVQKAIDHDISNFPEITTLEEKKFENPVQAYQAGFTKLVDVLFEINKDLIAVDRQLSSGVPTIPTYEDMAKIKACEKVFRSLKETMDKQVNPAFGEVHPVAKMNLDNLQSSFVVRRGVVELAKKGAAARRKKESKHKS